MKEFAFYFVLLTIFIKYTWLILLKDKKETTITNAFQNVLDEPNHKPNKVLVDKGR